jgi:hypothetical protein
MRDAGLLTRSSSNTTPILSSRGINIGQDIARSLFWDEAVNICEKRELYSFDSITMAIRQLAAKAISDEISKQ